MVEGYGSRTMAFSHQTDKNFVNQRVSILKCINRILFFLSYFVFSYAIQIYKFHVLFENCNDIVIFFCPGNSYFDIIEFMKVYRVFTDYLLKLYFYLFIVFLGDPS